MKKGKFIVFGGGEGSGKSTQIKRLMETYPRAVFTREPGGSEYAEEIRKTMLSAPGSKQASGFAHLSLALASCEDSFRNVVAPAVHQGKLVFSDRSAVLCSWAYEIFGYEKPDLADVFLRGRDECFKHISPDLYVIFDLDVAIGQARKDKRNQESGKTNHFDDKPEGFHERVRAGYLDFAKKYPQKTKIIDASLSPDEVFAQLQKAIQPLIS